MTLIPALGATSRPAVDQFQALPVVPVVSPEAAGLARRADDAVGSGDWKLAIDSLARLMQLPGDQLVEAAPDRFESARAHGRRALMSLPPEGLRAYRLLFDGPAVSLYEQAAAAHDETGLRSVAERYPASSIAGRACLTLAEWLMDEGRWGEAFDWLDRAAHPNAIIGAPAWVIPVRQATCLFALGRAAQAEQVLADAGPAIPPETLRALCTVASRPAESGRQTEVHPVVTPQTPWALDLYEEAPPAGFAAIESFARDRGYWPTTSMSVAGEVLVVRSAGMLAAIHLPSFEYRWRISTLPARPLAMLDEPEVGWTGQAVGNRRFRDLLDADPLVIRVFHDTVGGGVLVHEGLAVAVEWLEEPPAVNELRALDRQNLDGRRLPNAVREPTPNQLIAWSTTDGSRAWVADTTAGPQALGSVQFTSVPVAVAGLLAAPARVNNDLFLCLLSPANGELVGHVYLCSLGSGATDPLLAMSPAVDGGTVFVPTHRGLVVAVDVPARAVRWISGYAPATTGPWLRGRPTAPAVAAEAVVVAPADADLLLCLTASTGRPRWSVPRAIGESIVAADAEHVWLAGKQARCVSTADARPLWSAPVEVAAGRPVLSGSRLYVPTTAGLIQLDAATGAVRPREPAASGNLLMSDDSLLIADVSRVSRHVDVELGRARAAAIVATRPSDPAANLRLAWMEHLSGQHEAALRLVRSIPAASQPAAAHLRVLSALSLAEQRPGTAGLALMQEAIEVAQERLDVIAARMALGAGLAKEAGSGESAARAYAELALMPAAEELTGEAPRWRASFAAWEQFNTVLAGLQKPRVAALRDWLEHLVAEAAKAGDIAMLRRLAEMPAELPARRAAEQALIEHADRESLVEEAAVRRGRLAGGPAEASPRLVLGTPGEPRVVTHNQARAVSLPGVPLDRELILIDEKRLEARAATNGELIWSAELRLREELSVDSRVAAEATRLMRRAQYDAVLPVAAYAHGWAETMVMNTRFGLHAVGTLTGRRLWTQRFDPPVGVPEEPAGSGECALVVEDLVISLDAYGTLTARRLEDGDQVVWEHRLPRGAWRTLRPAGSACAVIDVDGLAVLGLDRRSGRLLGRCAFVQPSAPRGWVRLAVTGSIICGASGPEQVSGFDLADGGRQRWTAAVPGLRDIVKIEGGKLLLVGTRSQLVDGQTGARSLELDLPAPASAAIQGDTLYLISPGSRAELRAVGLADGRPQWGHSCPPGETWMDARSLSLAENAVIAVTLGPAVPASRPARAGSAQEAGGTPAPQEGPVAEAGGTPTTQADAGDRVQKAADRQVPPVPSPAVAPEAGERPEPLPRTLTVCLLDKKNGEPLGTVSAALRVPNESAKISDVRGWPDRLVISVGSTQVRIPLVPPAGGGS